MKKMVIFVGCVCMLVAICSFSYTKECKWVEVEENIEYRYLSGERLVFSQATSVNKASFFSWGVARSFGVVRASEIAEKMRVDFDPENYCIETVVSMPFKINREEIPKEFLSEDEQILYDGFRAKATRKILSMM